ncbi:MAG: hypothetical protein Q8R29_03525 [bacterium]|nr:hypothetical protein [bacterium]
MVLSYTNEVNQSFKERMVWWYAKLNNVKLKIWQDPWLFFMLCWMMFDAYLTEISQCDRDRGKLNFFYNNDNDFKRLLLSGGKLGVTALKNLSPVQDMRPNSNAVVHLNDENDVEQVFNFIYQIRCNLFHGAKNVKSSRDYDLVNYSAKFLKSAIDRWMIGN